MKSYFLQTSPSINQDNIVFVFGAGASYADGAPLQKEILPIIISGELKDIKDSPTGKLVREFLTDNFAWNEEAKTYPTLETVFGFLDYFISQDEHLSAKYPNAKIRTVKEGLIKLIHYVISQNTNREARIYQSFWETVYKYNPHVSILTLNYDTLLEEAFKSLYPEKGYIDYGIYLMNYEMHEEMGWVNPENSLPAGSGQNPVTTKIMKVHGSLNWKYCNCCNQVLLTPWDTKINLYESRFAKKSAPNAADAKHRCPVDGSEFETLIIPPSHIKKISHPIISQILNKALREIRLCKKIVFVGYSFPDADVHFKALFKKGLLEDKEIVVVNRSSYEELKLNYLSLSKNIRFIECSFADFIQDKALIEEIAGLSPHVNILPAPGKTYPQYIN